MLVGRLAHQEVLLADVVDRGLVLTLQLLHLKGRINDLAHGLLQVSSGLAGALHAHLGGIGGLGGGCIGLPLQEDLEVLVELL